MELARGGVLGQEADLSIAASEAPRALCTAAAVRRAVHQHLQSVVREICTRRSVGAGGG